MSRDLAWLPDRHLAVAATLAHADELLERTGDLVFEYLKAPGGPITLEEVRDGRVSHTTIKRVAPIPRAIALYTADTLTTLRAAIEHALYGEVEHALGSKRMTVPESRAIEMPAAVTADDFENWVRARQKRAPAPLLLGAPLLDRVRALQPYQSDAPATHPMKLLAEHTNQMKHRSPAVSAIHVPHLYTDTAPQGLSVAPPSEEPVQPGDILATIPLGTRTAMTYFPTVSLQRPHTGEWPVLIHELARLADWTRTIAVPVLINGDPDVAEIPPRYETHLGHDDERSALANGTDETALQVLDHRRNAAVIRMDFPEILAAHPEKPSLQMLETWVASLSDQEVAERFSRLQPGRSVEVMLRTAAVVGELIEEARRYEATTRA